jgi:rfaE bifunctional protein nucleotidyltransferase chain/domain
MTTDVKTIKAISAVLDQCSSSSLCVEGAGGWDLFYSASGVLDEEELCAGSPSGMMFARAYPRGSAGVAARLRELGIEAFWHPGNGPLENRSWICRNGQPILRIRGKEPGAAEIDFGSFDPAEPPPWKTSESDCADQSIISGFGEEPALADGGEVDSIFRAGRRTVPLEGESVVAGNTWGRLQGLSSGDARTFGRFLGRLVAEREAGRPISMADIRRSLVEAGASPVAVKFLARGERLLRWRSGIRSSGQRLVMANGCFDLFHPGHMHLLRQAASFGDHLLVAVNSDVSVRGLKGQDRPIQAEGFRAELICGLDFVAGVTLFDEVSVLGLVQEVLPDVLVKGGDYRKEEVVGWAEVEAAGGRVETVPLREGFSTTSQVEKMGAYNRGKAAHQQNGGVS